MKYTIDEQIKCMIYLNETLPNDREEAIWYRIHVADYDGRIEDLILNRLKELGES